MSHIDLTIIVPVYNGSKYIEKFMSALLLQESKKILNYEIIFVDNNSTDESVSILRTYSDNIIITEEKKGSYAARNAALNIAKGDYIFLTDIDCELDDNVFQLLNGYIEDKCNDVISGKVAYTPSAYSVWGVFDTLTFLNQEHNADKKIAVTANLFVPMSIFGLVGLFDGDLQSGGDVEWTKRLINTDVNLIYDKNLVVNHPVRETFDEVSAKVYRVGYGNGQLLRKSKRFYAIIKPSMLIPTMQGINKISELTPFKRRYSITEKGKIILSVLLLQVYNYYGKICGVLNLRGPKG